MSGNGGESFPLAVGGAAFDEPNFTSLFLGRVILVVPRLWR
jgi:hypothetical protein